MTGTGPIPDNFNDASMSISIGSTLSGLGRVEIVPSRTARQVIGLVAFVVATALSARVALPLPGTPVPFTLQPLVVMLAGALLGSRLGATSQAMYLALGVAGLPVFAAGGGAVYLLGPTGGYLLAYPLAAWITGRVVGPGVARTLAGLLAGLATIYLGGVAWLAVLGGMDGAVAMGLRPFVLADLVKALVATLAVRRLHARSVHLFGR